MSLLCFFGVSNEDWQDEVANLVDEVSALEPYEGFRDFALMAEELFGTEV